MEMNWTEIKELLDLSLKDLTGEDGKLLYLGANERSITHRLAYHLEKHLRQKYNVEKLSVDCEYNRETNKPDKAKRIGPVINEISRQLRKESNRPSFDDTKGRTVFPDIIIHERGEDNNLLVIEAKKEKEPSESDSLKLCSFTDPDGAFHYSYGVFIGLVFDESSSKTTAFIQRYRGKSIEEHFAKEYETKI